MQISTVWVSQVMNTQMRQISSHQTSSQSTQLNSEESGFMDYIILTSTHIYVASIDLDNCGLVI